MEIKHKSTIIFVCHNMAYNDEGATNTGGMQKSANEFLARLKRTTEYNIEEITLKCKKKEIWYKAPFYFIKLPILLILKTWKNDKIIVLYASLNPAIGIIATSIFPITRQHRQIAFCHGLDIIQGNFIWQIIIKMTLKKLDKIIANSNATKAECLKRGVNENKLEIIYPAIELEGRTTKDQKIATKGSNFICLIVGRQIKRKGTCWFIKEVMPILPNSVILWVVGTGSEYKNIRREMSKRNLENRVHLFGKVSDSKLQEIYNNANIFIMPNIKVKGDIEGFGRVILEAGLAGLYSIGSNVDGVKDAITKFNGTLVKHKNSDEYKIEIEKIKNLSLEARIKLGKDIKEHIREKYALEKAMDRYIDIFVDTISLTKR